MNGHALRSGDRLQDVRSAKPRWEILDSRCRGGKIKAFDSEVSEDVYLTFDEVNKGVVDGDLIVQRPAKPRVSAAAQRDPALDAENRRVSKFIEKVEKIRKTRGVSALAAYDTVAAEHLLAEGDSRDVPPRATFYRYLARFRQGLPILVGNGNKGNRENRYPEAVVEVVCGLAREHYLQEASRWELRDLRRLINGQLHRMGLLAPDQQVSRAFLKKVIAERLTADPEIHRLDPKTVPAAKSIAAHTIHVSMPFERVEQDALHLPFVARTHDGNLTSNIYLVHAIDCSTSIPLGWHMVVGSPSESDGLKCVESTLFSKSAAFERLGLNITLDVHGSPQKVVYDNGPETRGSRMGRLVRLGIDTEHLKSRHPHQKPYIERLNRSLKEALQTLPGCTRMDGKDGARDPIKAGDNIMDIVELERWIVRWYYQEWCHQELDRHLRNDIKSGVKLGNTPAQRWEKVQELGYALPLSPPTADWQRTLYDIATCTLSPKTGITLDTFNYRGDHLPALLRRYGKTKVQVLFDPDDYRQIFVEDGDDRPLVPLTEQYVDSASPAHSFSEMKEIIKAQKGQSPVHPDRASFQQDLHRRATEPPAKRSGKKQSVTQRNQAAAKADKEHQAVQRAANRPLSMLPAASPPPRPPSPEMATPSLASPAARPRRALPMVNRVTGEAM